MNRRTRGQQHRHDAVAVIPDVSHLETTRPFTQQECDQLGELLGSLLAPDERPLLGMGPF